MKHKKLTIIPLTLGMMLVSCGGSGEKGQSPLTPKQQEQANAIEKMIEDELIGTFPTVEAKPYATLAASKGGDVEVFEEVIDCVEDVIENFNLESLLEMTVLLTQPNAIKGIAYIGSAFANTVIDAVKTTPMVGQLAGPVLVSAQTFLNTEVEGLADSLTAIVNNTVSLVTELMLSEELMENINTIYNQETGLLSGESMQNVVTIVTDALLGKLPLYKVNAQYLAGFLERTISFVVTTVNQVANLITTMPQEITGEIGYIVGVVKDLVNKLYEKVNTVSLVNIAGGAVDLVDGFVRKLATMPDEFYEHVDEVTNRYEQYSYIILSVVNTFIPEEIAIPEMTANHTTALSNLVGELYQDVTPLLNYLLDSTTLAQINTIVEAVKFVLTHNEIIPAAVNTLVHLINNIPHGYDALEVSQAIGAMGEDFFNFVINTQPIIIPMETSSIDQVPQEIRDNIPNYNYWISEITKTEAPVEFAHESITTTPVVTKLEEGKYKYAYSIYIADFYNNSGSPYVAFGMKDILLEIKSDFGPIANLMSTFLSDLATSNLFADLVEDLINVATYLLEYKNTKYYQDGMLFELIPENVLNIIKQVLDIISLEDELDNRCASMIINEALLLVSDLIQLNFVAQGEEAARIDLAQIILNLIAGNMDAVMALITGHVDAASVELLPTLCEDLYNFAVAAGLTEYLNKLITSLGGDPAKITTAEGFSEFMMNVVKPFLDPNTLPVA